MPVRGVPCCSIRSSCGVGTGEGCREDLLDKDSGKLSGGFGLVCPLSIPAVAAGSGVRLGGTSL